MPAPLASRAFCASLMLWVLAFLLNNYLNVWQDWPGAWALFSRDGNAEPATLRAWLQGASYGLAVLLGLVACWRTRQRSLTTDAAFWEGVADYLTRAAFWAVLLIGLADALISFLRVEDLLASLVGQPLADNLGRAAWRGSHVHMPLLILALVVALRVRVLGVSWLALLVVMAELGIVITRFVFSYEQTFMGDLVRFWYAGLFLFASAYTLREDGHVRVDVLYSQWRPRTQARLNALGILALGMPICLVILVLGLWDRTSSLNSPLVAFEISQSGYGLFIKYLMAGFLVVFALSMLAQFCGYLLRNLALLQEPASARGTRELMES